MDNEDEEAIVKIWKRYHDTPYDKWPSLPQIAFDFGQMHGIILKLKERLRRNG